MPEHYEFADMNSVEKAVWEMATPLPLTDVFVNRPCTVIMLGLLLLFVITGFVVQQEWFTASEQTERDYLIWSDPATIDRDKVRRAEDTLAED